MSFLEHLEELRSRLRNCLVALAVGVGIGWFFSRPLLAWLTLPLREAYSTLVVIRPAEAFLNRMKAAFLGGIFLASPVIFYQLWAFVSPGLFPRERRYTFPFLLLSVLFFLVGAFFCYHVAMPVAVRFLAGQGAEYEQSVTLDSAFHFASRMLLGLGLLFEMPIVMLFLSRLGILTPRILVRYFRHALLAIFALAALLTPTPDVMTQTIFALPMIALYWVGVLFSWLAAPRSGTDVTGSRREEGGGG